jgi:hypothetical protein
LSGAGHFVIEELSPTNMVRTQSTVDPGKNVKFNHEFLIDAVAHHTPVPVKVNVALSPALADIV